MNCVSLQILLPRARNLHIKKSAGTTTEEGKEVSTKRKEISLLKQGGTTSQSPCLHCQNSPELGSLVVEVCLSSFLEEAQKPILRQAAFSDT